MSRRTTKQRRAARMRMLIGYAIRVGHDAWLGNLEMMRHGATVRDVTSLLRAGWTPTRNFDGLERRCRS